MDRAIEITQKVLAAARQELADYENEMEEYEEENGHAFGFDTTDLEGRIEGIEQVLMALRQEGA